MSDRPTETQPPPRHDAFRRAKEFVRNMATNYDHDEDSHRYGHYCFVCDAEKLHVELLSLPEEAEPAACEIEPIGPGGLGAICVVHGTDGCPRSEEAEPQESAVPAWFLKLKPCNGVNHPAGSGSDYHVCHHARGADGLLHRLLMELRALSPAQDEMTPLGYPQGEVDRFDATLGGAPEPAGEEK